MLHVLLYPHAVSGAAVHGSNAEGMPQVTEIHGMFANLAAAEGHAHIAHQSASGAGPSISGIMPQDTEVHGAFANLPATAAGAQMAAGNGHVHPHGFGLAGLAEALLSQGMAMGMGDHFGMNMAGHGYADSGGEQMQPNVVMEVDGGVADAEGENAPMADVSHQGAPAAHAHSVAGSQRSKADAGGVNKAIKHAHSNNNNNHEKNGSTQGGQELAHSGMNHGHFRRGHALHGGSTHHHHHHRHHHLGLMSRSALAQHTQHDALLPPSTSGMGERLSHDGVGAESHQGHEQPLDQDQPQVGEAP